MMVQRWGILQMAIAMVNALAKGRESAALLQQLSVDTLHIMNHEDGYVPMEPSKKHGISLPRALMEPGRHFADVPRNTRRQHERANVEATLPRQRLLKQVIDSHLKRPTIIN
jgi:hypothetical protein